jgi:GNAT superfamily N-acetyltransferase
MTAEPRFRLAEVSDIFDIVELLSEHPLWDRYGYTCERRRQDIGDALRRGDIVLVAMAGDSVIGIAWVVPHGAFGRSPYLRLLAVRRGAERRGIGRVLLTAIEERACAASTGGCFLLVSDFNRAAQSFYEQCGYLRLGEIKGFVLPDVAEVILWKPPSLFAHGAPSGRSGE